MHREAHGTTICAFSRDPPVDSGRCAIDVRDDLRWYAVAAASKSGWHRGAALQICLTPLLLTALCSAISCCCVRKPPYAVQCSI